MSAVEVKPYGGVRRPSVVFTVPVDTSREEAGAIFDRLRELLPDVNMALISENMKVTIINQDNEEANTMRP